VVSNAAVADFFAGRPAAPALLELDLPPLPDRTGR
jgi:hypothetical protein